MQKKERKPADRYLISYQKLCLFPFLGALISLFATFMLYARADYSLNIAFFLIRFLQNGGLDTVPLWLIGLGIAAMMLFLSAFAAKGKWWLLIIAFALYTADLILGLTMQLETTSLVFGMIIHFLFILAIASSLFLAYLTTKALKKEKLD